jgi:hypothetical protein
MVNEAEETHVDDQAEPPMAEPEPEDQAVPEPEPEPEKELLPEMAWADLNVALGQHIAQVASTHATAADRSRIMAASINAANLADQLRTLASRLT